MPLPLFYVKSLKYGDIIKFKITKNWFVNSVFQFSGNTSFPFLQVERGGAVFIVVGIMPRNNNGYADVISPPHA